MRCLVVLLLSLLVATESVGQDWPQWLGPQRNGVIDATIAPWSGDLEVAWKKQVGEGHSSPIVANGYVYLHHKAKGIDEEVITCWDLAGEQKWESRYPRPPYTNMFGNGPRATPAVAEGKLYTLGVTGILACWNASTGKQEWKHDLLQKFQAKNLFFGTSSSPLVLGKNLYVMPGGPNASVVALNKDTGDVVWQSGSDGASYASPMVTTIAGKSVVVFLTKEGLVGFDEQKGDEFFRVPLRDKLNESSTTPVRVNDLLIASSVTFGSLGVKVGELDGKPVATQAWKEPKLTCYFGTPVECGGRLHLVTGMAQMYPPPKATLHCVDPTNGKTLWSKVGVGKYHATLLRTKDKVLMLEEDGALVLLEPNDQEYKELARAKICGTTWAHPAWANGVFYIRDGKDLVAVKLPGK